MWRRRLLIAAPFVLIALGGWCLVASPWPAIWRLMLHGAHVTIVATWSTVGLPAAAAACFATAVALSLMIKRA